GDAPRVQATARPSTVVRILLRVLSGIGGTIPLRGRRDTHSRDCSGGSFGDALDAAPGSTPTSTAKSGCFFRGSRHRLISCRIFEAGGRSSRQGKRSVCALAGTD